MNKLYCHTTVQVPRSNSYALKNRKTKQFKFEKNIPFFLFPNFYFSCYINAVRCKHPERFLIFLLSYFPTFSTYNFKFGKFHQQCFFSFCSKINFCLFIVAIQINIKYFSDTKNGMFYCYTRLKRT